MTRILITGASGFVGANLARALLRRGDEVHVLLRPDYRRWRLTEIEKDLRIEFANLLDSDSVSRVLSNVRPECVFHLAAYGAYEHQNELRDVVATNLLGTINLVEAARIAGASRIVNAGSSSEYGFKDHAPDEDDSIDPNSYYAVAKASATMFCRYTAKRFDLAISTLRLYSVYGPYEEPTRLIPSLIVHGLEDRLPPLVNRHVARDFVYVDDAVEAFITAAQRANRGEVYNIGTGVQTSIEAIVAIVKDVLDVTAEPHWGTMNERHWDTTTWVANSDKARDELGWVPSTGFAEGFARTVAWLRESDVRLDLYREGLRTAGSA